MGEYLDRFRQPILQATPVAAINGTLTRFNSTYGERGLAGPAYPVDGVIEINQALAKAGGITTGDAPLFPVTISQPGSYRFTGNLDVTDAAVRPGGMAAENATAIEVKAGNVTIDLNGFMVKGPTVCSGSPTTCAPTGNGAGVLQGIGGGLLRFGVGPSRVWGALV